MSASVAPELLELQSFVESTVSGSLSSKSKKSVPWLQIVILVVGTRGDVQPFLAIAKKLQMACLNCFRCTHVPTPLTSYSLCSTPIGSSRLV
ncbi:hypothetical protein JHK82_047272 [Glycine max]|uniref:Glycosyltransferase family 28 N-terminal domain-containing protein n=2 Tax=Glycine subgen. Soja TaxID=1462606 RepID=K7ML90_SOYBN|nr:hypothetical protein JHK86_047166 [Glycine max]KAG4932967.1 hypothetical protein JHK87_046969 [Glycine soja]KAG4943096.1 hypothetical protein JHK85_047742 [Glycine max]KAG5097418.1 hypothetical protein JHK82_047272 [Glycine max]KAG5102206.1 hypothetical protein JHK84_047175 [Glycine max]